MLNERERLLNMLMANKISDKDFKTLSEAIEKEPSQMRRIFSMAVNPFQKIAGFYSLLIGLIIIVCMSYIGVVAKLFFPGILSSLNAAVIKNPKAPLNFFMLLYQNIVCWLVLSVIFIIFAKMFQKKRLRMIDFFGTVALSRFPILILTAFISIIQIVNPGFLNINITDGIQFQFSIMMTFFTVIVLSCVIWQIVTYFFALRESSGLSGQKLWISFIGSMIIGELVAQQITTIFL